MTHSVTPSGRTQTRAVRRRAAVRLVVATTLRVLVAGLVWGLGSALAADPSASPGGDKITLRVAWTNDPDNLNPFIGAKTSAYEIWTRMYVGAGAAFYTSFVRDSYINLKPKGEGVVATARSSTLAIAIGVAVALAVVIIVVLVLARRRRGLAEEE